MKLQPALFYNASNDTFMKARLVRKRMTASEKLLWEILRRNSVKGFYFRSQHPILIYIADFYCHKVKLVVELDGEIHNLDEAKRHDASRDEMMKGQGITVLRFKNEQVFESLDSVVMEIEKYLK